LSDGSNGRAVGRPCLDWTQKGHRFTLSRLKKRITRTAYATPVVPAADTRRHRHQVPPPTSTQHAPRATFCSRLFLQQPSLQTVPQDPAPSCSNLTFGRPSLQTCLVRSFLRETTAAPFWTTSTRFDLQNLFIFGHHHTAPLDDFDTV